MEYAVTLCFLVISYACVLSYNMSSIDIIQVSLLFEHLTISVTYFGGGPKEQQQHLRLEETR